MINRNPGDPEEPEEPEEDDPDDAHQPDRRGALVKLLFILALVVGGLLLVHVLRNMSQLQDCVMSGRTNCAPIQ